MRANRAPRGFTLIELLIIVGIIGILISIGIARYRSTLDKSREGSTKGNLGALRSALSIYYGDNENFYPYDDLSSLVANNKYLPLMPLARTPPYHPESAGATAEATPTDTGRWSYDNDDNDPNWGRVLVGCLHTDTKGGVWTTY